MHGAVRFSIGSPGGPAGLGLPECGRDTAPRGCFAHGLELSGAKVKTSVCVLASPDEDRPLVSEMMTLTDT